MSTTPGDGHVPLFTIGYGARSLDAFFAVLKANDIAYLIDIRSAPYSRFKPEFSKDALEATTKAAGFTYVYMGETLGGQPQDATCYEDGKVVYDRVKERPFFREGMARLRRAFERNLRVALMCSEGKPEECHRTALIGQALADEGIGVVHIDENDCLVGQDEAVGRRTGGQLSLLGNPEFKSRKRYKKKTDREEAPEND